ncbi:MAG: hypothetical protein N2689_00740 [Verrucomicrobiae bacterium]|nr:hypothetical protein [Verrucomicrobiae bacterium]
MRRRANAERRSWLRRSGRRGQSLVESCVVVILLCLLFYGFLQVGILYNHERALQFASFAASRSATVGFNSDVYSRTYRAAAIPASGQMEAPFSGLSQREQLTYEAPRDIDGLIARYLNPLNPQGMLSYEFWDPYQMDPNITAGGAVLTESHQQEHPLQILRDSGLLRAFYGSDTVRIPSETVMGCHFSLYLQ